MTILGKFSEKFTKTQKSQQKPKNAPKICQKFKFPWNFSQTSTKNTPKYRPLITKKIHASRSGNYRLATGTRLNDNYTPKM
jgi:hypothetical protein